MRSSFSALKTGMHALPTLSIYRYPECKHEQDNSELGAALKTLAVTQDWLAALREYRSTNDLEVSRPTTFRSKHEVGVVTVHGVKADADIFLLGTSL
jgi:hypothetical protein